MAVPRMPDDGLSLDFVSDQLASDRRFHILAIFVNASLPWPMSRCRAGRWRPGLLERSNSDRRQLRLLQYQFDFDNR
jgi:endonuclease/exonuclease/phosphatase (EEP) superfamily protein YafD